MNNSIKPAFKESKPERKKIKVVVIANKLMARALAVPFVPTIVILVGPFFGIKYILDSFSTVKSRIESKIKKHKLLYKIYLKDSEKADNIYDIDKYLAWAQYFNTIREAYVNLLGRKTSDELESFYHHKSSLKDDDFISDKKSANDNLTNSLLAADEKMLSSKASLDNEVYIHF